MYFKDIKSTRLLHVFCALAFSLMLNSYSHAEMVVIVHPENNSPINKASIKKIFLGKTNSFLNGQKAVPIEMAPGELRKEFLKKVLRKGDGQLASYWSRMMFSGKATPPKTFDTSDEIKELVSANPNIIGFIDSDKVDNTVKVVELL